MSSTEAIPSTIASDDLLALYTVACAPLSSHTLINDVADLTPDDATTELMTEELKYFQQLMTVGLDLCVSQLEKQRTSSSSPPSCGGGKQVSSKTTTTTEAEEDDEDDDDDDDSVPLTTLITINEFLKRAQSLSANLAALCAKTMDSFTSNPAHVVKSLETRVKNGDRPPIAASVTPSHSALLESCFDYTPNTKWAPLDVPLKNRVGFKAKAAVIFDDKVEEEELKTSDFRRKKQRNPTGFHKFNFKDLGVEDSDIESDNHQTTRSRAGSGRGNSTDGGSTRGSLSHSGGAAGGGAMTSRSVSSGGGEDLDGGNQTDLDDEKDSNPFTLSKAGSAVVFSFDKEREVIEDPVADPQWDLQQRHQKRYSRIRNRVPTGHPSMMRGTSDDLAGLVNEYEKQISCLNLDAQTAENTELNKSIAEGETAEVAKDAKASKGNVTIVE